MELNHTGALIVEAQVNVLVAFDVLRCHSRLPCFTFHVLYFNFLRFTECYVLNAINVLRFTLHSLQFYVSRFLSSIYILSLPPITPMNITLHNDIHNKLTSYILHVH